MQSASAGLIIRPGFDETQRADVAHLYWEAFGAKLERLLWPSARAEALLMRVLRADHCLSAIGTDGKLLGVVGFKTPQGSFAGFTKSDLVAIYGHTGAIWRKALMTALSREIDNERFLLDGICVATDARGRGVGRALLASICAEAAQRGYRQVRLDVVETNYRARRLYEHEGFQAVATASIGPLRHVFRFSRAITMVREVRPEQSEPAPLPITLPRPSMPHCADGVQQSVEDARDTTEKHEGTRGAGIGQL